MYLIRPPVWLLMLYLSSMLNDHVISLLILLYFSVVCCFCVIVPCFSVVVSVSYFNNGIFLKQTCIDDSSSLLGFCYLTTLEAESDLILLIWQKQF